MTEPKFNLLLVYKPGRLDPSDFRQIADFVRNKAPDIEPFVISDHIEPRDELGRATARPFLVFAPIILEYFRPQGGKIYCGRTISKLEQMTLFRRRGIPVPKWKVITPGTRLARSDWGPFVVVKPVFASLSQGVELLRTEDVRYRLPQSYPVAHPGRKSAMIVQAFIDPGPYAARLRVLTLFGEPLYAEEIRIAEATARPAELTSEALKKVAITTTTVNRRVRTFVYDKDVLDLARRTYSLAPDVPLHACDIIREWGTGKLYMLEFNPGGNTWHFSSRGGRKETVGRHLRQEQFGAFEIAADLLIERTRREAL